MTDEKDLMEFLQRKKFFNKPYNGNREIHLVVCNPTKIEFFSTKLQITETGRIFKTETMEILKKYLQISS